MMLCGFINSCHQWMHMMAGIMYLCWFPVSSSSLSTWCHLVLVYCDLYKGGLINLLMPYKLSIRLQSQSMQRYHQYLVSAWQESKPFGNFRIGDKATFLLESDLTFNNNRSQLSNINLKALRVILIMFWHNYTFQWFFHGFPGVQC